MCNNKTNTTLEKFSYSYRMNKKIILLYTNKNSINKKSYLNNLIIVSSILIL